MGRRAAGAAVTAVLAATQRKIPKLQVHGLPVLNCEIHILICSKHPETLDWQIRTCTTTMAASALKKVQPKGALASAIAAGKA